MTKRDSEPVATRPFGDHTVRARCEKCGKIWVYDRREQLGRDRPLCPECDAAQPAAGTTPFRHSNGEVDFPNGDRVRWANGWWMADKKGAGTSKHQTRAEAESALSEGTTPELADSE